jgi:hypothetical protein
MVAPKLTNIESYKISLAPELGDTWLRTHKQNQPTVPRGCQHAWLRDAVPPAIVGLCHERHLSLSRRWQQRGLRSRYGPAIAENDQVVTPWLRTVDLL